METARISEPSQIDESKLSSSDNKSEQQSFIQQQEVRDQIQLEKIRSNATTEKIAERKVKADKQRCSDDKKAVKENSRNTINKAINILTESTSGSIPGSHAVNTHCSDNQKPELSLIRAADMKETMNSRGFLMESLQKDRKQVVKGEPCAPQTQTAQNLEFKVKERSSEAQPNLNELTIDRSEKVKEGQLTQKTSMLPLQSGSTTVPPSQSENQKAALQQRSQSSQTEPLDEVGQNRSIVGDEPKKETSDKEMLSSNKEQMTDKKISKKKDKKKKKKDAKKKKEKQVSETQEVSNENTFEYRLSMLNKSLL